jgi:hypothetical protein
MGKYNELFGLRRRFTHTPDAPVQPGAHRTFAHITYQVHKISCGMNSKVEFFGKTEYLFGTNVPLFFFHAEARKKIILARNEKARRYGASDLKQAVLIAYPRAEVFPLGLFRKWPTKTGW